MLRLSPAAPAHDAHSHSPRRNACPGKKLVNDGSHMLDLCCAIVGEDEKGYITSILERIATRVRRPDPGGLHRGRRSGRGAEADSGESNHQLD